MKNFKTITLIVLSLILVSLTSCSQNTKNEVNEISNELGTFNGDITTISDLEDGRNTDKENINDELTCYNYSSEKDYTDKLESQITCKYKGKEVSYSGMISKLNTEYKLSLLERDLSIKYGYRDNGGCIDGIGGCYAHFNLTKVKGLDYISQEDKKSYTLNCRLSAQQPIDIGQDYEKYLLLFGLEQDCFIVDNQFGSYEPKFDSEELKNFHVKINEDIKKVSETLDWVPNAL